MNIRNLLSVFAAVLILVGCDSPTSISSGSTSSTTSSTLARFAAGVRTVKINTYYNPTSNSTTSASITAPPSFILPTVLPAATPIPTVYPGYDGATQYRPGVSPTTYYDQLGNTISKPSWLVDFQLGMTALPGTAGACATFGGAGGADVQGYYRVSENNCGAYPSGTPNANTDVAYVRIILNRDNTQIGTAENLVMQVEYQAQSLRLNSDGIDPNPENNLDQLWKVFWNSTLSSATSFNPFSVFVPPNYASCMPGGTEGLTGSVSSTCVNGYTGAPITTKQVLIPLSAYPTLSVIQLNRMSGRINIPTGVTSPNVSQFTDGTPINYVNSFLGTSGSPGYTGDTDCETDSPLCLGVVIRSVTLMRL